MRNLILSIFVLLSMFALAATASAQPAHPSSSYSEGRAEADRFRARHEAEKRAFRAQESRELAYRQRDRYWLEGPAADVRCGIDPVARFCTYRGRQLGWSWDDWSWGRGSITLFDFGRYSYDPAFAGETYWVIPYALYSTACPATGPADTVAPRGYEWRCEPGVHANYGAYVKKSGRRVLRDYAQRGIVDDRAIVVGPKS